MSWTAEPVEEPDELRALVDMEALRGILLKHTPELVAAELAVGALLEARGGTRKAVRGFWDALERASAEGASPRAGGVKGGPGAAMAGEYCDLLENSDLSLGGLRRALKEEALKTQGLLEAVSRRSQVIAIFSYLESGRFRGKGEGSGSEERSAADELRERHDGVLAEPGNRRFERRTGPAAGPDRKGERKFEEGCGERREAAPTLLTQACLALAPATLEKSQKLDAFWERPLQ